MEKAFGSELFAAQFNINVLPDPDLDLIQKYKTEICRNWEQWKCNYGKNCLFAHGKEELRQRSHPRNYKTKLCLNILRDGFCKYGNRCQFKHRGEHLKTAANSPMPMSRDSSAEERMPIFVDIERRCL